MAVGSVRGQRLLRRLGGWEMVQAFTMRGTIVGIGLSETVVAACVTWWGIVLLPGPPDVAAPVSTIFTQILPEPVWAAIALFVGLSQLVGITLAWLGIRAPLRHVRLAMLIATVWWWGAICFAVAASGLSVAPVTYGALLILSMRNFRQAYTL